jgi:N-acetyl-1-D-myo-inositol-2-amino-2-deoxy-alpha-D-glucopyranoside deacetylase
MSEPTLLAIFAHPDDETFRCGGSLALLAARGARVQILTATRGQAGSCGEPPLCTPDELPLMRERELRCACAALGSAPPILLDYSDGALADVDEAAAAAQLLAVIEQVRPTVLLTWPADGLSGHPDHCAVSRWTARAFYLAAGLGADAPRALYHLAVPHSVASPLGLAQLHAVPNAQISLAVKVEAVWERKLAAIGCHRTQLGGSPILRAPAERQRLFLGTEHFIRYATRGETQETGHRDCLQALEMH